MAMLFDTHFAATCFMTGVIWFVQLVHYPLFNAFDTAHFAATMKQHQYRTSWVVMPAMLVELGTCIGLALALWPVWHLPVLNLALLGLIWLSTFFVSVPLHARLEAGPSVRHAQKLVTTNWIRTVLWSARCVLLLLWGKNL